MSRTTVFVDVSDLLRHGARTGIQRVVGQVLPRLAARADDELELLMLRFDPVEHHYLELDTTSLLAVLAGTTDEPEVTGRRDIGDFGPGDVFLDLDSAWNSPLKRSTLYPLLKHAGATIVSYVYDLVPLKVPEVVHETTSANWVVYLSAVLSWSDLVMTDSRSAERDLLALKEELDVRRHLPTLVTRLGCDLPEVSDPGADELALLEPLTGGRFVLFVGTIEPRKEHLLAVRAFDELAEQYPDVHLVLAGRKGWIEDDTISTITGHPSYGERVHWIRAPSDALLAELYRRATACLYLSRYEGYGLPIAEALAHGRVTVASYGSGMPEVGGDACDFVWHNLVPEVVETLAQYLGDADLLAARERHIRDSVRPLSWDTVTGTIEAALRGLRADEERLAHACPERLQVVVLGDHSSLLRRAVAAWGERTDLVSEIVVVAPQRALARLRRVRTRVPVVPVDRSLVAAARGWDDPTLPTGLADLGEVDDVFVLVDESHLPPDEIALDAFVTGSGRMTAYHLQELTRWTRREDELDDRQRATARVLGPRGFELLGYAGRRPQLVDKNLLREAAEWAASEARDVSLAGWSAYLNHAVTTHPSLFEKRASPTADAPAFERNAVLDTRNERQLRANDLAHGPIRFAGDDVQLLVAGLPQLVTVALDTHVSLDLSYQLLARGTAGHDLGLSYRVDDGPVSETRIRGRGDPSVSYESGSLSLPVAGTWIGVHDVEFFLQLDGRPVRAAGLRYLAKLVVVAPEERPAKYYDLLAR